MALNVVKRDGSVEPLEINKIHRAVEWACNGLDVSLSEVETSAQIMLFNGIKSAEIQNALIRAAGALITIENPDYTFVASRLLLQKLYKEVTGGKIEYPPMKNFVEEAVKEKRLNPDMLNGFDFAQLDAAIVQERDLLFTYLGLQTISDRYLIRARQKVGDTPKILELPQHMWMRVAMGLSLNEDDRTGKAIEFYSVLSTLEFVDSTPTLFNSGTLHSQLSSCYLNTVTDSIDADDLVASNFETERFASIFGTIQECANLSKFAGGIGTDWTSVRSEGDVIESTNGKSSGIIPYLKIFNDTAVAVNQGGKRNGAFAAYLEPWHPDFYDFIDLKKKSGDERRRAHDIFPAAWAPDLFFERVEAEADWSFFSPAEYPELHELFGEEFKNRYEELEAQGKARRVVPAVEVWRKWLSSMFETGHPWVTFKDECNRRNPQDHVGVIHNSNLCTEITLNTSKEETAVCNLGSINLSRITTLERLFEVIRIGARMLDNVIDLNFYPSERARLSNMRHRPVGMGVMGYTEWLVQRGIQWDSNEHILAADALFENISFAVISANVELAKERGAYGSFDGSKWSRGILPIDTARDQTCHADLDWDSLRAEVMKHGVRNSNMMAIAPTATISNIAGTTATIEPPYLRSYTKSNLSGSFLVVDPSINHVAPEDIKRLCKEAFEIDPLWVVRAAAVRQKWIDQAQSVNIFVKDGITGSELANIYMTAWKLGLKTTYYLRSQAKELGAGSSPIPEKLTEKTVEAVEVEEEPAPKVCSILDPTCESCQ